MASWCIRLSVLSAVSLAAGAMLLAPVGSAAGEGGPIKIYSPQTSNGAVEPILITGAITDYGKAISVTKAGKPDPNGAYEKLVLKKGTFWVDGRALNTALNKVRPTVDRTHCYFEFSGSGPTTLFKGSGAYAGISGTAQIKIDFVVIGPRLASGKCNTSNNAKPLAQYGTVTGSGTAKFA
jgi:hypothetical protein